MIRAKATVRPYSLVIVCAFVNAALELGLLHRDPRPTEGDLLISSAGDGVHGPGSVHSLGMAVDFRTKNLTTFDKRRLRDKVRARLGPAYDCILEDEGGPNEHLHVERDPVRGGLDT